MLIQLLLSVSEMVRMPPNIYFICFHFVNVSRLPTKDQLTLTHFIRLFLVLVSQCFPGCLTIQIRTVLCIFIVLLIYAVAQACVVSRKG